MNDIKKLRDLTLKLASLYSDTGDLFLESVCYDIYSRILFLEDSIRTPRYLFGTQYVKECDCNEKENEA